MTLPAPTAGGASCRPARRRGFRRAGPAFLRGLAACALLSCLAVTQAFEFRSGDRVVVAAGERIVDDLYVAAPAVEIAGHVEGDLIVAGDSIVVSGRIDGDMAAAGRTIVLSGEVGGDARLAGAELAVEGAGIAGDVVAAGYSLLLSPGGDVGGDLAFSGRQALLEGGVGGDAVVAVDALEIAGPIGGNLEAAVGDGNGVRTTMWTPALPAVPTVASGLTMREGASVGGDLHLRTPERTSPPDAPVRGEVAVDTVEPRDGAGWIARFLRRYLSLALLGLLLMWVAPVPFHGAAGVLEAGPAASLATGAIALVGIPLALALGLGLVVLATIALGIATLGGLAGMVAVLGIALLLVAGVLFAAVLAYLAFALVGYVGGRLLLERFAPDHAYDPPVALLLGLLAAALLAAIPGLGWLVTLAVFMLALGALWRFWRSRHRVAEEPLETPV